MSTPTIESARNQTVAGKFLTFALGRESYGVSVLKVREIIRLMDITAVPQMPAYVKGVINLRGKVVPVVDLRLKFGLAHANATECTCIVVAQVQSVAGCSALIGFVVDAVEEVISITSDEIEPAPDFGAALDTDYILGMAKLKGRVKTLLDIDGVLTADTLDQVTQTAPGHQVSSRGADGNE
jgi:purine-binding chemotaxis protein CheW